MMGISGPAYFMLSVGGTLHVQRVGYGSIWHCYNPSRPLIIGIQNLMIGLRDGNTDDGAVIKRCDSLAEEFTIGGRA